MPTNGSIVPRCSLDAPNLPGVLHAAWVPDHPTTLALALADGTLRTTTLADTMTCTASATVAPNSLALWVDPRDPTGAHRHLTSAADGSVTLVATREDGLVVQQTWSAHDLEAWMVVFGGAEPNLAFSGADDAKLCCWDLRTDPHQGPVWSTPRSVVSMCL